MDQDTQPNLSARPALADAGRPPIELTPELVKAVADRVYAMFRLELKIEHERDGFSSGGTMSVRGGWR